jgi:hypothetical protein
MFGCESVAATAQAFLDRPGADVVEKSDVCTACYDRSGADDGSDGLAADDSFRPDRPNAPRVMGRGGNAIRTP